MNIKSLFAALAVMTAALTACSVDDNPVVGPRPATTVKATEVTNLTPNFIASVSGITEGQEVAANGSVTLTLTPGEFLYWGFAAYHMEHIHIHVGDRVYQPVFPATGEEYVPELTVTVPVPDEAFPVVVAYAVQQQLTPDGHTMRLEPNADGVELYGVSPDLKYKYFDCYLRVPDAYTLDEVEFRLGDGEWQALRDVWGCSFYREDGVDNVYRVTVRPDYEDVTADVTLRVSGTQHQRCKITWKNTDYINFDVPEGYQPNILPASAVGGETVFAQFYTKDDYYFDGATASVSGVELQCLNRAYVIFTMPEEDVEIMLDFKEKIPVSYQPGTHIAAAELYDQPDIYYGVPTAKAIPGEYIFLFVKPETGFKPVKAVNDAGEESAFEIYGDGIDRYAYYAGVHVPEGATSMTVSAEAAQAYVATGENIYFDGGSYHIAGETVTFSVYVPTGQTLDAVTAADADGNAVAVSMDGTYGSFVMPAADVTVTATYKAIPAGENVTITALYDEDEYSVYSQSSAYYGRIDSDGITVPTGTTLYISVMDDYGMPFWVGVKIGDTVQTFEAQEDEDTGEYTFGRSFVFSADATIKVGPSQGSVGF